MIDARRKHGWGFWSLAAIVVAPFLYPLSFGPVCRIAEAAGGALVSQVEVIYTPLVRIAQDSGWEWPEKSLCCYGGIMANAMFATVSIMDGRTVHGSSMPLDTSSVP